MKCIQAIWPKHIPKGHHYQIIVFSEMTVAETPNDYWGRLAEPVHTKYYIQKIYATSIKEDWEADIKELMQENPKRTDVIAQIVKDVALIEAETKIKMRNGI